MPDAAIHDSSPGAGQPVDAIDNSCKELKQCYQCANRDTQEDKGKFNAFGNFRSIFLQFLTAQVIFGYFSEKWVIFKKSYLQIKETNAIKTQHIQSIHLQIALEKFTIISVPIEKTVADGEYANAIGPLHTRLKPR